MYKSKPITDEAYLLLHEGSKTLAQIEGNGMRIDIDYLNSTMIKIGKQIKNLTDNLKNNHIYKKWQRIYGGRTNLGSRSQLSTILFKVMKLPYPKEIGTIGKSGNVQADEKVLETLDLQFAKDYLKIEKLKKARGTYLKGLLREATDGFIHPFFNLHLARTYRSSSDHPNFQNVPVRNPETSKLIRQAFISRPNHQIVEIDFTGVEICGAACYHKDPRMTSYIEDKTKDLHRDMAQQCFLLSAEEMKATDEIDAKRVKIIRYCGKNMFVFPEFYGDYYISISKSLWDAITRMNLKTRDGKSLLIHLRKKGITKLGNCDPQRKPMEGTFEKHIQDVENDFWNKQFKVYNEWKKKWYNNYLKTGGFNTLTGFHIEGDMKRNQVINYPIQGTSFHFLLWTLIQINRQLKKHKMKSLIVGQIHDSIVADIHKDELKDYLQITHQVMTIDIRKHWKWINVPITTEVEISPVDGNWYQKVKYEL